MEIICIFFYALYSMILYSMYYIICIVLYTLYSMPYMLCIIFYLLYSIHCTVCIVLYALLPMIYTYVLNTFHSMHVIQCFVLYTLNCIVCIELYFILFFALLTDQLTNRSTDCQTGIVMFRARSPNNRIIVKGLKRSFPTFVYSICFWKLKD